MPGVTIYLPMEDLIALKAEGEKRKKSRSALLKERIHHKCPPAKPPRWPDDHKCPESIEHYFHRNLGRFGDKGWAHDFPDGTSYSITPKSK